MNKQEFIKTLKEGTLDKEVKLKVCQFYLDKYPVKIKQQNPRNPFEGIDFWTKIDIKINGGSDKAIDFAFKQLQGNVNELEKFEI